MRQKASHLGWERHPSCLQLTEKQMKQQQQQEERTKAITAPAVGRILVVVRVSDGIGP